MVGAGKIGFSAAEGLCRAPGNRDAHAVYPARPQALELFDARRVLRRNAPEISRKGNSRRRHRGYPDHRDRDCREPRMNLPQGPLPLLDHGQFASGEAVPVGPRRWRRCLAITTATEMAARTAIAIRIGTKGEELPPSSDLEV